MPGERARYGALALAAVESAPDAEPRTRTLNGESETRLVVLRALARLPIRQRITVVLRYFEDLTEAQVADRMGCSIGTVKSQHAKAMASLRRDMNVASLERNRD
jgi:RNA polymerase sigma factor (sigma-70 family)